MMAWCAAILGLGGASTVITGCGSDTFMEDNYEIDKFGNKLIPTDISNIFFFSGIANNAFNNPLISHNALNLIALQSIF